MYIQEAHLDGHNRLFFFFLTKGKLSIKRIQRYNRPYTLGVFKIQSLVFVLISGARAWFLLPIGFQEG